LREDWKDAGFGIYIHWPFCAAKCPYCDFNSHVSAHVDQAAWQAAYVSELDRYAALTGQREVASVFFGGGTPSLMVPKTVETILDRIAATWPLATDIEITLEANPGSVEACKFRDFARAGVNRVALGVQALDDQDLRRLGRLHSVAEALSALEVAHRHFSRTSIDLIYARQNQTVEAWDAELNRALQLGCRHLSLYQLTIEPGTAFGDRYRRGKLRGLPDEDRAAEMYDVTQSVCETAGLSQYEVSNHAGRGEQSRHNLIYWRYGDYLGIGPGAHGRRTLDDKRKVATEAITSPSEWLRRVSLGEAPEDVVELTHTEQAIEMLLMGMRLREGVPLSRVMSRSRRAISKSAMDGLIEDGVLQVKGGNIAVEERHFGLLNAVLERLVAD
jgi:putative oxygen-independent coproporphyrinogen III oxidase